MKRILYVILVLVPSVAAADKTFNTGKGVTWDCKKDPVVSINHGGGTYKLKGACTTINVNGGGGKLTIESVDELNLAGAKITVTVGTVATINLLGNKNKVTWKTAKTGDAPAINHIGKDNVVAQTGTPAGDAKTPPTVTTAAAPKVPAGTAVDCGKTPVFSYNENDSVFTLTGKCDKVMIAGNNNKVNVVDSVDNVMLSGNDNSVAATAVNTVATSGNNNTVTYKGTKPKVMNPGNGNKITPAK
jgi:hypothetical protein